MHAQPQESPAVIEAGQPTGPNQRSFLRNTYLMVGAIADPCHDLRLTFRFLGLLVHEPDVLPGHLLLHCDQTKYHVILDDRSLYNDSGGFRADLPGTGRSPCNQTHRRLASEHCTRRPSPTKVVRCVMGLQLRTPGCVEGSNLSRRPTWYDTYLADSATHEALRITEVVCCMDKVGY